MKDIHEVLRQKQTKYAQLGKQIEMLQQAAEKLREVAPLLAENDDEDNAVLMEGEGRELRYHWRQVGPASCASLAVRRSFTRKVIPRGERESSL
jgi:hypothetical protein